MASSTLIPNPVTNNTDRTRDSSKRRKRKKFQRQSSGYGRDQNNQNLSNNNDQISHWKSEAQQQVYSSKLLQAVRHVRQSSGTGATNKAPRGGRAISEAAYRALAVTAKGRTRWSRAILTNKLKLKFMICNRRQRGLMATTTGNIRPKKQRVSVFRFKTKKVPAIQKKTRVLGGLLPGCRKQPLPVVLEEAIDYIPALEMQVKTMAALFELLSGGSSSTSVPGAGNLGQLSFNRPPPSL